MVVGAELYYFGMGLENERFLDPTYCKKPRSKFTWLEGLQVGQSRLKSYADHRRRELSFDVGNFVYLKVSAMRGLRCLKVRGKLAPRFIGPFKILKKRGEVAYQLELPPQLSDVHDVFHVSQLKKYPRVPKE
jgi:hypothetical protein